MVAQLALGHSNAEIAAALYVSEATVKAAVSHILESLHLENRTQAAVLAHRASLDPR